MTDLKTQLKEKKKELIIEKILILEQATAEIKDKDKIIDFYAETLKETNEEHKIEIQQAKANERKRILEKINKKIDEINQLNQQTEEKNE